MKRRSLNMALSLLAGSAGLAASRGASGQGGGWTALFNGRDFEGWDRIGDAVGTSGEAARQKYGRLTAEVREVRPA